MSQSFLNSTKSESGDIKTLSIASNVTPGKSISIKTATVELRYYESILDSSVRVSVVFGDTGNSLEDKSVLRELPVVGTEKCEIAIADNNDHEIRVELLVDSVKPLRENPGETDIALSLVSQEFIVNDLTRVNIRFDGKISDHITKILTEQNFIGSQKTLDIEPTQNNYNFFGNNRKPLYLCNWLCKKSVPNSAQPGKTAGYFFYETSLGYKFKSIETLLEQKPKRKLIFTETPDSKGTKIPEGYDGKVLVLENSGNFNAQKKFESGAYHTRHVKFDPFNCFYEVTEQKSEDAEASLKLAGKELPKLNPELGEKITNFTKTTYAIVDKGTIPSGSTEQQIDKAKEINFDYSNIVNQASQRYNQLFTIKKSITIAGDFSLNAGDTIFVDAPETAADKMKQGVDPQTGGLYIIADLCHYITPDRCLTKLNLVRDSYGRKVT